MSHRGRPFAGVVVLAAVLVAGCSSSSNDGETSTSTTSDPRGGVQAGYSTEVDELAPLVIRPVAPDPIPVTGTDGKVHVVYELEVLNFSPREVTLTRLETLAGGPDGEVVASVEGEALGERTALEILVSSAVPNPVIPVGRTALILVDDVYDTLADVPEAFTHRLNATFGAVAPEYEAVAQAVPYPSDAVSLIGGPGRTSTQSPVVIGPPLAGTGWLAFNACCELSPHRGAIIPIGGRINAGERFAIDWMKADDFTKEEGDPTKLEFFSTYGEALLAVADGTVVKVVSGMPDITPLATSPGLKLDEFGGNAVIIDIGNGVYASYSHMVPGSATVRVGDKVTRGQVIGRLGNSGNTTAPHLHFQLQRTVAILSGDNVPYEIDTLTFVGSYDPGRSVVTPGPNAGARTNQLPLIRSVVDFPAAP